MTARLSVKVWVVLLGLTAAFPAAAAAQEAGGPPLVSVGAGAGVAFPFHGDFDFTAWTWDTDVRLAMSRHTLFEVSAGDWRHTETLVDTNVPAQGPSGLLGTLGRIERSTRRVQRAIHASVLLTGAVGRVRLSGGGGVGLLQHNRRWRQTIEDCSAGLTDACGLYEDTFTNISGSIQGSGGADVALTDAFSLYGQARFTIPMTDPAGADLRILGGIRWRR